MEKEREIIVFIVHEVPSYPLAAPIVAFVRCSLPYSFGRSLGKNPWEASVRSVCTARRLRAQPPPRRSARDTVRLAQFNSLSFSFPSASHGAPRHGFDSPSSSLFRADETASLASAAEGFHAANPARFRPAISLGVISSKFPVAARSNHDRDLRNSLRIHRRCRTIGATSRAFIASWSGKHGLIKHARASTVVRGLSRRLTLDRHRS